MESDPNSPIKVMESSGLFNAGTGAHLQLDGVRRMDASIRRR
jgi:beta-aspartyl-peptidase (threonine type)